MAKEYESVHRVMFGAKTVRVWTKASPGFDEAERDGQRDTIERVLEEKRGQDPLEALASYEFVNGVEIMDAAGRGRIIYPEWP